MKKIILIILLLISSGCSNDNRALTLNINDIQSVSYNDINLISDDFDFVKDDINKIEFEEGTPNETEYKDLEIVTKEKIHKFKISDNNIYYEEDDKYYISKNINNLKNALEEIEKRYTDFSFFNFEYGQCTSNEFDLNIKIDSSNKCLIINTNKILLNFKIHSVHLVDNNLTEDDLLYQKNEIDNNKIIIKSIILSTPKIKINFETKYNYNISILPTYNEESGDLELNSSHEQKNRQMKLSIFIKLYCQIFDYYF